MADGLSWLCGNLITLPVVPAEGISEGLEAKRRKSVSPSHCMEQTASHFSRNMSFYFEEGYHTLHVRVHKGGERTERDACFNINPTLSVAQNIFKYL